MTSISSVTNSRPKHCADFCFYVLTVVDRFSYCVSLAISDGLETIINHLFPDYQVFIIQ